MYEFEMLSEVLIRFRNVSFLFMILLSCWVLLFLLLPMFMFPFNVRVRPVFWKACIHEKLPPKERFSLCTLIFTIRDVYRVIVLNVTVHV